MNLFDEKIILFFNQFAQRNRALDNFTNFIAYQNFIKSGILVMLLWWFWFQFKEEESNASNREHILATIVCCLFAIFLGRIMALALPFRPRPMHNPALFFQLPYGSGQSILWDWSSFPSDHAILFFSLATGLFFISRPIGILALLHAVIIISLPRVYVGIHYPSDIIVGGVIGVFIALFGNQKKIKKIIARPLIKWLRVHPSSFYVSFFVLSYQIVNLFDGVRKIGISFFKLIRWLPNFLQ
jgi:undecaprenyl-diphosphatase